MLIRFFRNSFFPQYFALFILAIVLWIPALYMQPTGQAPEENLVSFFYPGFLRLTGYNHFFLVLFNFIVVFGSGIFANYTLEKNDLIPRNSLLASFFYILFLSHTSFIPSSPVYLASFLLLVILYLVLGIYRTPQPYKEIFNSGLLVGLSSIIYFPSIYFIFFVWVTFVVYRIYYWREWIILPLGIISLYLLVWTYYFLFDILEPASEDYVSFFKIFIFSGQWPVFSIIDLIIVIAIGLLFLWSFLKNIITYGDKILIVRKRITIIYWFFIITTISFILSGLIFITHQILILAAISFLVSIGISSRKKIFWFDIFTTLVTILIVLNKYLHFLQ